MRRKDSFRVVSSKIKRFVDFVGASLPCHELTGKHWRRWERWLKREKAAERLAHSMAKFNYSRAREFARWLIANGKATVEGLEKRQIEALP